jgi:hypothetical protein
LEARYSPTKQSAYSTTPLLFLNVYASFEKVVATSAPQGNILFSRGGIIQIRQPGDVTAFVDASRDQKTWTLIAVAGNGDEVSAGDGTGLWFFRTRQ